MVAVAHFVHCNRDPPEDEFALSKKKAKRGTAPALRDRKQANELLAEWYRMPAAARLDNAVQSLHETPMTCEELAFVAAQVGGSICLHIAIAMPMS